MRSPSFYKTCALALSLIAAAGCSKDGGSDGVDAATQDMRAATATATLVVNEVFPHGADELTDPDWVEIKNIGQATADLSGYQIQDDKTKMMLPDGLTLGAGAYLVIDCDDSPDGGATDRIHAPFKLGSEDEFYLLDPSGNRVDGATWDKTLAPSGKSYGRLPDGTGQFIALTPTPAARNL